MTPSQSPFPGWWLGVPFEYTPFSDLRPESSTYAAYDLATLPAPPPLAGDFAWLRAQPLPPSGLRVRGSADWRAGGVRLPAEFATFLNNAELPRRVQSATDCYLNVDKPLAVPSVGGHVVRFLSDSQGCLHWYLYITPDETDHAVVCSRYGYREPLPPDPDFAEFDEEDEDEFDPYHPTVRVEHLTYCAGSFEEFLWRFWVENELLAERETDEEADEDAEPELPPECADYIARYRELRR